MMFKMYIKVVYATLPAICDDHAQPCTKKLTIVLSCFCSPPYLQDEIFLLKTLKLFFELFHTVAGNGSMRTANMS